MKGCVGHQLLKRTSVLGRKWHEQVGYPLVHLSSDFEICILAWIWKEKSPLLLYQVRSWSTFGIYSGGLVMGKVSNFSTPCLLITRQILGCNGEIITEKLNRYLFARNQDFDPIHKPAVVQDSADRWKTLPEGGLLLWLGTMNDSRRFFCLRVYMYKLTMARPYIKIGLWPTSCSNQSRKPTYCLQ